MSELAKEAESLLREAHARLHVANSFMDSPRMREESEDSAVLKKFIHDQSLLQLKTMRDIANLLVKYKEDQPHEAHPTHPQGDAEADGNQAEAAEG